MHFCFSIYFSPFLFSPWWFTSLQTLSTCYLKHLQGKILCVNTEKTLGYLKEMLIFVLIPNASDIVKSSQSATLLRSPLCLWAYTLQLSDVSCKLRVAIQSCNTQVRVTHSSVKIYIWTLISYCRKNETIKKIIDQQFRDMHISHWQLPLHGTHQTTYAI